MDVSRRFRPAPEITKTLPELTRTHQERYLQSKLCVILWIGLRLLTLVPGLRLRLTLPASAIQELPTRPQTVRRRERRHPQTTRTRQAETCRQTAENICGHVRAGPIGK